MTISDWLNLSGSLGLISVGSLLGSFITIFIKYWLDKNRLKAERQSNLQREIYFKLQEQAVKVFKELNLMNRQVEEMEFWLKKKVYTEITKIPVIEMISEMSSIQVFFSREVLDKYNKVAITFREIATILGLTRLPLNKQNLRID